MLALNPLAAALVFTYGATTIQTAYAQSPLEKLPASEMRADAHFTQIAQSGAKADSIKRTLETIDLPAGFRIDLYALAPGARHIAIGPNGAAVFVGTRDDKVWVVTDQNNDGTAEVIHDFAPAIQFTMPNGPCFSNDGTLYVPEQNRVLAFPDAEKRFDQPAIEAFSLVKKGALIPKAEESYVHSARVCKIGHDDKIYISLGQPYNVPPRSKLSLYDTWGIGGIIRLNTDGSGREVYTYGIRNSVGHDFHPVTGELWFTDNQVDGMGDDIPPGELNRQTESGQHFGFPWFGGGKVRTREYAGQETPANVVYPQVETVAHAADLGMTFYTGDMFPDAYRNAIFFAQHGSWDRSTPVGARVIVTYLDENGATRSQPFAEGWIDNNGHYSGRPVDVAMLDDGSLLVSDDLNGALYRITYKDEN